MWLTTKTGFLSLVQHRDDPAYMLVRARVRKDLEDAFPQLAHGIEDQPTADYRYRLVVSRGDVALYMLEELAETTYTSHAKEEMAKGKEKGRLGAYMRMWNAMADLQPGGPYGMDYWKRVSTPKGSMDYTHGRATAYDKRWEDGGSWETWGDWEEPDEVPARSDLVWADDTGAIAIDREGKDYEIPLELLDENVVCRECGMDLVLSRDFTWEHDGIDVGHEPEAITRDVIHLDTDDEDLHVRIHA